MMSGCRSDPMSAIRKMIVQAIAKHPMMIRIAVLGLFCSASLRLSWARDYQPANAEVGAKGALCSGAVAASDESCTSSSARVGKQSQPSGYGQGLRPGVNPRPRMECLQPSAAARCATVGARGPAWHSGGPVKQSVRERFRRMRNPAQHQQAAAIRPGDQSPGRALPAFWGCLAR